MNIWYGTGENAWLSNLAERPFKDLNGWTYVSVEHAYQSWKSGAFDGPTYGKPWTAGSKFIGTKGTKTGENWNLSLMRKLVKASFEQNPDTLERFRYLHHGDVFTHNQDKGIWREEFPKILREIVADDSLCRQLPDRPTGA
tara:strand:- start:124 stop:546 length:423 start_codon:yes stop_codon:yes gene_type:complete